MNKMKKLQDDLRLKKLKKLPKIDLHIHIDGAVRTETIIELAKRHNMKLPTFDPVELGNHVKVPKDCKSIADFLKAFEVYYPLLKFPDAVEQITYEVCEDSAKDNVKYFEPRFAPVLQSTESFSIEEVVKSALNGLKAGKKKFGIDGGLLLCCYRSESPKSSMETVSIAKKYLSKGVVGIDFAGDERNFPIGEHKKAILKAKKSGIPITMHAGEEGTAKNIRTAVLELGADRIGHGTHLPEDKKLFQHFREKKIPLEICLTSNLQTQTVRNLNEHPFKKFYKEGLKVTINTDDPQVSSTTLSEEYLTAMQTYGLTIRQIEELIINAAESVFAEEHTKKRLVKEFLREFQRIGF